MSSTAVELVPATTGESCLREKSIVNKSISRKVSSRGVILPYSEGGYILHSLLEGVAQHLKAVVFFMPNLPNKLSSPKGLGCST
jgi:hypothetical protein